MDNPTPVCDVCERDTALVAVRLVTPKGFAYFHVCSTRCLNGLSAGAASWIAKQDEVRHE